MFDSLAVNFLGKVKDFLGVISEANKRLQLDAKDLMLGIADLHTPKAVTAAESAVAGNQPVISLAASNSGTNSEDSDDDTAAMKMMKVVTMTMPMKTRANVFP
ncbi:hypothetical protein Pint_11333 [Pistacia integerrima]|uniref:Uncharacterized protein n=1 Tax=Pistacia integerrima TaxID=434235 RepID=A0ACC0XL95_9ROSI|nr:hypothetical protein Pint_11333 [Pistacia integerrima]